MFCSYQDCLSAKDFIALDIEISNKNNKTLHHKKTTYYIEKLNSTEWLFKFIEFNLTDETFTYSFHVGREYSLNASVAYLGIDKLSLNFLEFEGIESIEMVEMNPIVIICISSVLAFILTGVMATFLYKNYKRPPRFKMFDHFYRASQQARLSKYTYEF